MRGHWTFWKKTRNHPAFAPIAKLLGQKLGVGAVGVSIDGVDLDALWDAGLACTDRLIAEFAADAKNESPVETVTT